MASQSHQPPAEEQLVETAGLEVEVFWHKYGRLVLVAASILVIAAVVVGLWLFNAHQQRVASEDLFAKANSPDAWREVIARYPKSLSAANAYFLIANAQQEQGDFAAATSTYQDFVKVFPDHPLVGGALLGIAENLLSQGKTPDALGKLREIQTGYSSNYAAPFAALSEGRILMREGKLADARRIFANILQIYPGAPAVGFAAGMVQEIDLLLPPSASPAAPAQ